MDRHAPTGQRCSAAGCEARGEPDREVPCAAWCVEHQGFTLERRRQEFRRAVEEQETRERNAAP